jgi:hypothetical protein
MLGHYNRAVRSCPKAGVRPPDPVIEAARSPTAPKRVRPVPRPSTGAIPVTARISIATTMAWGASPIAAARHGRPASCRCTGERDTTDHISLTASSAVPRHFAHRVSATPRHEPVPLAHRTSSQPRRLPPRPALFRQAFLYGVDHYNGRSFKHRRNCIEQRIRLVAGCFAVTMQRVDACATIAARRSDAQRRSHRQSVRSRQCGGAAGRDPQSRTPRLGAPSALG